MFFFYDRFWVFILMNTINNYVQSTGDLPSHMWIFEVTNWTSTETSINLPKITLWSYFWRNDFCSDVHVLWYWNLPLFWHRVNWSDNHARWCLQLCITTWNLGEHLTSHELRNRNALSFTSIYKVNFPQRYSCTWHWTSSMSISFEVNVK